MTGADVFSHFDATSRLRTQIEHGARADIFVAASLDQMARARRQGLVDDDGSVVARNRLVAIVPRGNPGRIEQLEDLARPGVRLVLAPREVPIGQYARDLLGRMSSDSRFGPTYRDRVLANLRSEEPNVRHLVAKVELGEADAAFVYASDVAGSFMTRLDAIEIPDHLNVIAEFPAAIVSGGLAASLAADYVRYLGTIEAQTTFARHGFVPVAQADRRRS
jgi:molybdate transport system substrate-binding protein